MHLKSSRDADSVSFSFLREIPHLTDVISGDPYMTLTKTMLKLKLHTWLLYPPPSIHGTYILTIPIMETNFKKDPHFESDIHK